LEIYVRFAHRVHYWHPAATFFGAFNGKRATMQTAAELGAKYES